MIARTSLLFCMLCAPCAAQQAPGYTDTPLIPGSKWRVHDASRPRPLAVDPGPPLGEPAPVPADATVLFGGSDLDAWTGRNGPAQWAIADGAITVNRTGDIQTLASFGSVQLHIEWCAPAEVKGESQGRGNSGVFLMGRYEVQILDSFENPSYADGQAAAMYGQYPPLVNACRPPGQWQTYDILFTAPVFEDGKLLDPARLTLLHNGIVVHNHRAFLGGTAHKTAPSYAPHGPAPIRLQDHGNPVRFRNIWVRPLGAEAAAAPAADGAGASPAGNYVVDAEFVRRKLEELPADLREKMTPRIEQMLQAGAFTFALDADGSFRASMKNLGVERVASGTWTLDGDQLEMTLTHRDGEPAAGDEKIATYSDGAFVIDEGGGVMLRFVKSR